MSYLRLRFRGPCSELSLTGWQRPLPRRPQKKTNGDADAITLRLAEKRHPIRLRALAKESIRLMSLGTNKPKYASSHGLVQFTLTLKNTY